MNAVDKRIFLLVNEYTDGANPCVFLALFSKQNKIFWQIIDILNILKDVLRSMDLIFKILQKIQREIKPHTIDKHMK